MEPKSYVAGSSADGTVSAGDSTQGGASVAGSVAVGIVVAALILLNGDSDVTNVGGPDAGLQSLTQYRDVFAAEVSAAAVVQAAPEIVNGAM